MDSIFGPTRGAFGLPVFALTLAVLPLRLDDPKQKGSPLPLPLPASGVGADDPHEEMKKLFGRIERDLRRIDRLLADASSGTGSTEAAKEKAEAAVAGITELLAKSDEQGRKVIAGIDRILELANHAHSSGGT